MIIFDNMIGGYLYEIYYAFGSENGTKLMKIIWEHFLFFVRVTIMIIKQKHFFK